jgi:hypothetical protein
MPRMWLHDAEWELIFVAFTVDANSAMTSWAARPRPGLGNVIAVSKVRLETQRRVLTDRLSAIDFGARTMSMNARSAVGTCRCPW